MNLRLLEHYTTRKMYKENIHLQTSKIGWYRIFNHCCPQKLDALDLNAPTENPPQLILVGENLPTFADFNLATSTQHISSAFKKIILKPRLPMVIFDGQKDAPPTP